MLTQVVDFPTPPFPLATAKTRAHEASEDGRGGGTNARGAAGAVASARRATRARRSRAGMARRRVRRRGGEAFYKSPAKNSAMSLALMAPVYRAMRPGAPS